MMIIIIINNNFNFKDEKNKIQREYTLKYLTAICFVFKHFEGILVDYNIGITLTDSFYNCERLSLNHSQNKAVCTAWVIHAIFFTQNGIIMVLI